MRKMGMIISLLLLSGILGCGIGPLTIRRDRRDYMDAISDSWKNQMLLNMVKLSYGDTPVFLDVSSVTASYGVSGKGNFGFNWAPGINSPKLSVTGDYDDSPTIEYAPMSGEKFARSFMTPLPACSLFRLVQAGFPIDLVLRACVVSINGVSNHYAGISCNRQADNDFFLICNQLRGLQDAGVLELRLENGNGATAKKTDEKQKGDADNSDPKNKMYICVRGDTAKTQLDSIINALHLKPPQPECGYEILNGLGGSEDGKYDKIGILTQSVLGVIVDFSSHIKAPKLHVLEDRACEDFKDTVPNAPAEPFICVNAVEKRPSDAFVTVRYKKYWFYIDDRDFQSKSMFTFLMFLFSLTETDKNQKPILTIPVG